ncbi:MAG: hypothetical protein F4Z46_06320 [Cenarchaeum sp. SB0667_bin_13]|nr:hypothetical protein [Cenarchaeum sp. SB0667_bin_13]
MNAVLKKENILICSLREIDTARPIVGIEHKKDILKFIRVPFPNDCAQDYRLYMPDTNLFVLYKQGRHGSNVYRWLVLGIVSCKTSFHARETESTFWALVLKSYPMRVVMATEDKNRYKTRTELGTCEKPTAARHRLEAFMDRVYIIKKYGNGHNMMADISKFHDVFETMQSRGYRSQNTQIFDEWHTPTHAGYCNKIKPFDDLISDIMLWKLERTQ